MQIFVKYIITRFKEVFLEADATTIRVVLALASLFFGLGLLIQGDTFDRPIYAWMSIFADELWWALALLVHFLATMWRVFDPHPRVLLGFIINLYGVLLWTFIVGCITIVVGKYSPSTSMEISVIIAAWMCLLKTGTNEGKGTP